MTSESLLQLAEKIATEAHDGQYRRGGVIPYIVHPKAVVERVGDDSDARVVAWLHDVIEDTEVTAENLIQFGIPHHLVTEVELLTKSSETRYEDYLERVAESQLATKVKIADMLSNLADNPTKRQIRKLANGLLRLTPDS